MPSHTTHLPLVVDLDGTLVRSDTLLEQALVCVKTRTWASFALVGWLLKGKWPLKMALSRVPFDVTRLPYDERVVGVIRQAREAGQPVVLATTAHRQVAEAVAQHLQVFDQVIASRTHNLTAREKAQLLVARFGKRGFDYAGNSARDVAVWRVARSAIVVNARPRVVAQARRVTRVSRVLPRAAWLKELPRVLRSPQWVKNGLLFVPLLAAHRWDDPARVGQVVLAFVVFCAATAAVYIANDLLDLMADRQHPRKRERPLAAGRVPLLVAVSLAPALLVVSAVGAWWQTGAFRVWLALYVVVALAYSVVLKRIVLVDVLALAGLYTGRVFAGGAAAHVPISAWLTVFSLFFFLGLAVLKRVVELASAGTGSESMPGRGYRTKDVDVVRPLGITSGYLSVLVFGLYLNSPEVVALYNYPARLWLVVPLLVFWISRLWLLAGRGALPDDPVLFAVTDKVSYAIAALVAVVVVAAL